MAGHQIDNPTRTMLEKLFEMSGGYVLDFSNASFAAFVATCLGFDPYDLYDGSKAAILRKIWISEPWSDVARLNANCSSTGISKARRRCRTHPVRSTRVRGVVV